MKYDISELKTFARHWLQQVSPNEKYGLRAALRDARLYNIMVGEMAYFAYIMLNPKQPTMNTQEKLASIKEALFALPDAEVVSFIKTTAAEVMMRQAERGENLKKEFDENQKNHNDLLSFVKSENLT